MLPCARSIAELYEWQGRLQGRSLNSTTSLPVYRRNRVVLEDGTAIIDSGDRDVPSVVEEDPLLLAEP